MRCIVFTLALLCFRHMRKASMICSSLRVSRAKLKGAICQRSRVRYFFLLLEDVWWRAPINPHPSWYPMISYAQLLETDWNCLVGVLPHWHTAKALHLIIFSKRHSDRIDAQSTMLHKQRNRTHRHTATRAHTRAHTHTIKSLQKSYCCTSTDSTCSPWRYLA